MLCHSCIILKAKDRMTQKLAKNRGEEWLRADQVWAQSLVSESVLVIGTNYSTGSLVLMN